MQGRTKGLPTHTQPPAPRPPPPQARYTSIVLLAVLMEVVFSLVLGTNNCWTYLDTQVGTGQR